MTAETQDHVFPTSWYPDSTPANVQRWTAPSCRHCNKESGEREQELFIRLALCIDPRKREASGISTKLARTFGKGEGISEEARKKREVFRDRILSDAQPYSAESTPHLIPGLGPHAGFPVEKLLQISISANLVYEVAKKIVRGCEFWLNNGRIIDPPHELSVFLAPSQEIPDVLALFEQTPTTHLGPGFRIRRAAVADDPLSALYEVVIWDSLKIYYSILPTD
jgi:hypothetical protein